MKILNHDITLQEAGLPKLTESVESEECMTVRYTTLTIPMNNRDEISIKTRDPAEAISLRDAFETIYEHLKSIEGTMP